PAHPRMSRSPPDRRALRSAVVGYRFSAFWLRSSVVSVLISLISDTSSTRGLYIKWIFGTGSRKRGLLRPLHASTRYCSATGNGALLSLSKNRILHGFPHSLLLCHRSQIIMIYIYIYIYIHTYIYIYIYIHTHIYIYIYMFFLPPVAPHGCAARRAHPPAVPRCSCGL